MKKNQVINIIREEIRKVLYERSIRQIKDKVLEIIKSDECLPYKTDEFTYTDIPLQIFLFNGLTEFDLKQYEKSSDIITFNLDINFNPIKKNVDVFLQRKGIFG